MSAKTDTPVVTMICPNLACGHTVSTPESMRGTMVRCPYCNATFRVPTREQSMPPAVGDERNRQSAKRGARR